MLSSGSALQTCCAGLLSLLLWCAAPPASAMADEGASNDDKAQPAQPTDDETKAKADDNNGDGNADANDADKATDKDKPRKPLEQVTLEATFTDAAGPFAQWKALNRYPMVVTFFYTRDRDRGRSRWALDELAGFQEQLLGAELAEGVYLVALTVDPRYDQAHRLKKAGESHGLVWPAARLLQPKYDDLPLVADAFALAYEQVDVETISFEPTFVVLAPGGKVLYEARGRAAWKPAEALKALRDWSARRAESGEAEADRKPSASQDEAEKGD